MDNYYIQIDGESTESFQACPYSWFYMSDDDKCNCRSVWKIVFLGLCLPFCYPCYITRALRNHCRKKEYVTPYSAISALSPPSSRRSNCPNPQYPMTSSLLSSRLSVCQLSDTENHLIINSIFLRTESSLSLLNSLSLELFNKEQNRTTRVVGRASVTINSLFAELNLLQETLKCDNSSEYIDGYLNNKLVDIDLVVIVVEEEDVLTDILSRSNGLIYYIKQYWKCYYPVLLVSRPPLSPDTVFKRSSIEKIEEIFSKTHHLRLRNAKLEINLLLEVITKFHQHLNNCSNIEEGFGSSLRDPDWKCLGSCGLRSKDKDVKTGAKSSLVTAKMRLFK